MQQFSNCGDVYVSKTSSLQCETCLNVKIRGAQAQCLIDTGCEHSCLPLKYVPLVQLCKTNMELRAANGTPIMFSVLLDCVSRQMVLDCLKTF